MSALPVSEIAAMLSHAEVDALPGLIADFQHDARPGVVAAVQRASNRLRKACTERERLRDLASLEMRLLDAGCAYVAGVDEVGRGALAGPVTACACVFARETEIYGIKDSKQLSERARERLASAIRGQALAVAVAHVGPEAIDRLGIGAATTIAMRQAIAGLCVEPDHVIVDGLPVDLGAVPCTYVVSGDSRVRAIAGASIVAKVTRDELMRDLDRRYPGYALASNKGYGSKQHLEALAIHGPSPIHRTTFAPCSMPRLW